MNMQAYIYQAALLCEDCGRATRAKIEAEGKAPAEPDDDSDAYPEGPYGAGGGESDTPQHCDMCGLFLENPLTTDGAQYVAETVSNVISENLSRTCVAWEEWRPFYGVKITVTCGDQTADV